MGDRIAALLDIAPVETEWDALVGRAGLPPLVGVEGDWEAYERRRSRKALGDVHRRRRRREQKGHVTLDVLDGREGLSEALEEGFRLEPSGWKGARGTAIVSDPRARAFYTEVARWAAARDTLRLAFLRLDGRALAFEYAIEEAGVHYYVKGGFDRAYAEYAPGKLL